MSALQTGERVNRIEYYNALMNQLLTIGESMLTSGAGVNKVEETLAAIGRAYGASRMDVFVITSCAIVTMYPEDSCAVTQTRRILSPGSPNFSRVEAFSKLSKECERTPITLEELTDRVESIVSRQYPEKLIYLGSVLAAGGSPSFSAALSWTESWLPRRAPLSVTVREGWPGSLRIRWCICSCAHCARDL